MATIYWPQHCNIFCCSICWPALFSLIAAVCLHGNISIYLHRMMFQTPQTIYFLKAHHLVMKMTGTNTNTKCFQDPMYAIFIESRGLKDLKYYTGSLLVMTKTRTRFYAVLGLNILQGWSFFKWERFSDILYNVNIWLSHNLLGLFSVDEQVLSSVASN